MTTVKYENKEYQEISIRLMPHELCRKCAFNSEEMTEACDLHGEKCDIKSVYYKLKMD